MSEPVYTAKTWGASNGRWYWQTLKDGKAISRGDGINFNWLRLSGVASREAAIEQCRLDMDWDRNCGPEEIVLNPETISEPEIKTESPRTPRTPGLYVVTTVPPGPNSEFVELEDQDGHGIGPLQSGAEWREEEDRWTFGPLAPIRDGCVVIYPRKGVSPLRVHAWLVANFQHPCEEDVHAVTHDRSVIDGNPLVNAHIEVEEP